MKTVLTTRRNESGSALLVSLLSCFVMGLTLASYLVMTQNQNVSVARSQCWNSAIAVSEAGIEDSLALLNKYAGFLDELTNWPSTAAFDNWTVIAPNVYYVHRTIGDGYYDTYITNLNNTPAVTSVGVVPWTYGAASQPILAAYGLSETPVKYLARKVDVNTKIDPLFNVALAALETINLNGRNVATDSFDSVDPGHSDNGLYPFGFPARTKDQGDVVTDLAIVDSLDVGNATIAGKVRTGPGTNTIDINNGKVGSKAWLADSTKSGIEPGWSATDMNVVFPTVNLPEGALGWGGTLGWMKNVTIDGVDYDYALTSGDYKVNSLSGKIYIRTNAYVRLYVTGSANFTGDDRIDISPVNAVLKIYMAGSFSTSGNAALNNYSQNAANLYLFGLASSTSFFIGGNGDITGVIYAPQAALLLGGGGSDTYDFVGASVSRSIRMNGHFNFHYDENLRRIGMGRGYLPTSWKES